MARRMTRCARVALVGVLVLAVHASPVSTQQAIRTQAEESGFKEYTRHENMMAYLRALQATTPEMKLSSYGRTWAGRELPYVIFSRPLVAQPWEAMASGKPIVLFQANVHGGERTQRESLMILMRELATPGSEANAWLDHLVLIIAPQVNPDGFEAQPNATRGNQWGIDLNRDYIKLEQPEIANLVTNLYHKWYPHLIIDGHNGGARPYNINYITTANASVDPALIAMCEKEIFPLVGRRNEEQGLKAFYYPGGNAEFWNGAPHYPRIAMTYVVHELARDHLRVARADHGNRRQVRPDQLQGRARIRRQELGEGPGHRSQSEAGHDRDGIEAGARGDGRHATSRPRLHRELRDSRSEESRAVHHHSEREAPHQAGDPQIASAAVGLCAATRCA